MRPFAPPLFSPGFSMFFMSVHVMDRHDNQPPRIMWQSPMAVVAFQTELAPFSQSVTAAAVIKIPASRTVFTDGFTTTAARDTKISMICPTFFCIMGVVRSNSGTSVATMPSTTAFFMIPAAVRRWAERIASACQPGTM